MLALSCLFFGVSMTACGRFAVALFMVGTLAAAFVFSVAVAYAGVKALLDMF